MAIKMIIKRVTQNRSAAAIKLLSRYVPKLQKMPLQVAKAWYLTGSKLPVAAWYLNGSKLPVAAWYKNPLFWVLIFLVVGIGAVYATRRYHGIDLGKFILSLIFRQGSFK